ncbi:kinase D-interacting substrate of 220 kDa B-like [Penaeus japonicus]|uniref:kinase D-interacting substrate of 220 kDa B-like n=1 Tax=Penaeus japonicus TaxID=27405 RepID=UPI001C70BFEB|nr:kinase D-interacting substrate of 220 kDa B-like [Penaeus japonicus]
MATQLKELQAYGNCRKEHFNAEKPDTTATIAAMGVHDRWPLVLMTLMAMMYLGCDFQASAQSENIFSIDLLFVMLSLRTFRTSCKVSSKTLETLQYLKIQIPENVQAILSFSKAWYGTREEVRQVAAQVLNHPVMQQFIVATRTKSTSRTQTVMDLFESVSLMSTSRTQTVMDLFESVSLMSTSRTQTVMDLFESVSLMSTSRTQTVMDLFESVSLMSNSRTQTNSNGTSLLLSSASGGVVASVRLLLAAGAYVNLRDENGWTALIWAACKNHSDVVKVLLEAGADPNIENWNYGHAALVWAAYNGNPTIVQDLLNAGAEVDHRNKDGNTAFLVAVRQNHLDIARILFNHGAYISAQNNEGANALIQAAKRNNLDMLRFTIQSGGSLNAKTTKYGDTALMWATSRGYLEVMRELLASGAEVDLANLVGYTALSMSIIQNQPEAARILLAFGADINQRAKDGDSVLMEAVNRGRQDMVEVLLQHCPDMSVENINRKTVFTLARQRSSFEIEDMINAHESTTCLADGRSYNLGSVRYDSCRQQQCCNSIWRNTGVALESCGDRCRTLGTASGTCVLVNECVRLEQVFLVTNAAGDVGPRTTVPSGPSV